MKQIVKILAPDSAVTAFAGAELTEYLCRIFPDTVLEQKEFVLRIISSGLRFDGCEIIDSGNRITISACEERGLLHGVYALLRKLGCSFLFPGKNRERIPTRNVWPLADNFRLRQEPWLEYRGICFYNTSQKTLAKTLDGIDWMAKNGFNFLMTSIHRLDDTTCGDHEILWDEMGDILLPELQKRGITIDMSEHSTDYYFPKETLFKEHPEWFALVDGVRVPGQICYSNQEAVDAYASALADFAKDKPWFRFMGIWPLDGGGYCECEHCKDPETIFQANCTIAAKLKSVRPDLTVEHLAYTPQSFARPTTPMPDNMCVLVCLLRDQVAYEWSLCAKNAKGAFYFDYMTGDHYRYRSDVILNPRYCRETVNALISYGYRGVVSLYLPLDCWFVPSLNYWYLSRLYYEPTADITQLHRELSLELFGEELTDAGVQVLELITGKLLDPILWNGLSHADDWYCEHITNRNRALDRVNAARFDELYTQITALLGQMQATAQGDFLRNVNRMLDFAKLQSLYYHCVDQFDADQDPQTRAEPYFEELARLEQTEDDPFISQAYARWRIVGRDNIFKPENTNLFQAKA